MKHRSAAVESTLEGGRETAFRISGTERLKCEALIIGTGAGGASVACTLAAAGVDVLMLEEGPYIPAADVPQGLGASMLRMWRGGGLLSTLRPTQISFAEGRCVGGGTEINSAIFQRAPEQIVEQWSAANHLREFSMSSLSQCYERASSAVSASEIASNASPPTAILSRAGEAMGWKVDSLQRGQRNCVGANMCAAGCPTGGKQSMSSTLIPRALAAGARLVAQCRVQRLTMRGDRATGAVAAAIDHEGHRRRVTIAAASVFLCAGTMQTPMLIRRSGIASAAGWRFQLHPTIRVLARFRDPVQAHLHRLPLVAITEFMPDVRFGGSIFNISTFATALAEDWQRRSPWLRDYAHYVMYYAMIKPDGVGRIFDVPGALEPIATYRLTERDWRRLSEALRNLSVAVLAAGAERVTPSIRGHDGWSCADDLRGHGAVTIPRDKALLMSIHLFGSCPMGEDSGLFPVDSFGCLAGTKNIVVADGSMLPGAPGVNPQATIMALAFRAADAFISRRAA